MSAIVDIEPLMRGLYEEIQMGGETYSTQSVYEMIEKETSKVEVFTKADMIAILEELRTQMEEYEPKWAENDEQAVASCRTWEDLDGFIQKKINALRGTNEYKSILLSTMRKSEI